MPALEIDHVASKKKTNSSHRVPARGAPRLAHRATDVVATKAAFDDSHMITTRTLTCSNTEATECSARAIQARRWSR